MEKNNKKCKISITLLATFLLLLWGVVLSVEEFSAKEVLGSLIRNVTSTSKSNLTEDEMALADNENGITTVSYGVGDVFDSTNGLLSGVATTLLTYSHSENMSKMSLFGNNPGIEGDTGSVPGDNNEGTSETPGQGSGSTEDPDYELNDPRVKFTIFDRLIVSENFRSVSLPNHNTEYGIMYTLEAEGDNTNVIYVDPDKSGDAAVTVDVADLYSRGIDFAEDESKGVKLKITQTAYTSANNGSGGVKYTFYNSLSQSVYITVDQKLDASYGAVKEEQVDGSTYVLKVYYNSTGMSGTLELPLYYRLHSGDAALEFYAKYTLKNAPAGRKFSFVYDTEFESRENGTFTMKAVNNSDKGTVQGIFNLSEGDLNLNKDLDYSVSTEFMVGPLKADILNGQMATVDYVGTACLKLEVKE